MSDQTRWTVRNVDLDALALLVQVRDACGQTTGVLLSEAIRTWYGGLPEIDYAE
jgi:hypothetical protein